MAGYSGDAGNALMTAQLEYYIANGKMFTTPDSDNDDCTYGFNCASLDGSSGWWFSCCSASNINLNRDGYWSVGDLVSPNAYVQASRMLVKLI